MGSLNPPELSLDCRLLRKTIGDYLAEISRIDNASDKVRKLDDYVNRLGDEMKKIDAFKRELPLCMLLLNNAIAMVKEELKKSSVEPVLEQFIPLKDSNPETESSKEKDIVNSKDKMDWMSSVQLWNSDNPHSTINNTSISESDNSNKKKSEEPVSRLKMDSSSQIGKNSTPGRAFLPFRGSENFPAVGKEDRDEFPGVPGLSLAPPQTKNCREDIINSISKFNGIGSRSVNSSSSNEKSNFKNGQQQTGRKQRRCWSPELHRRFINALQQLGGAQAATPKQIRELMQVDGLTNDEVKSHLQKYRLHSRRVPPKTNTSTTHPRAMGNSWVSQEQCGESSKQSSSKSDSPHGPLHLPGSSRCTSITGCDGMEDEDDEKSESHSWKSRVHLSGSDHS